MDMPPLSRTFAAVLEHSILADNAATTDEIGDLMARSLQPRLRAVRLQIGEQRQPSGGA
jgi:hypothetical protein